MNYINRHRNDVICSISVAGSFLVGVLAIDNDAQGTLNSTIDYKIISVTPRTKNAEFYLQNSGTISFKGCLDYEVGPIDDMHIFISHRMHCFIHILHICTYIHARKLLLLYYSNFV